MLLDRLRRRHGRNSISADLIDHACAQSVKRAVPRGVEKRMVRDAFSIIGIVLDETDVVSRTMPNCPAIFVTAKLDPNAAFRGYTALKTIAGAL